jgi:predicted NBD/HSP70 family sugar kinase
MLRMGIDLGGTKIEIIALDDVGKVQLRKRVETPQNDYQATLRAIHLLIQDAEDALGEQGSVGIGMPGAISPASGLVKNSNSVCLNGMPFKQDIEALLNREIRIANDANCFALSEAVDGAAAGAESVFGVIVGTGTGAGIVIRQQVLQGVNAISGEWGHNPLPWPDKEEWPGPDCYCGKQGCIETFLSGTGFAANHAERFGGTLSSRQIVEAAIDGDKSCIESMSMYEDQMARGLAHVINILDPDVIVLGGGMSNVKQLYQNVPERWEKYVFSDQVSTRLLPPVHGDSSGVRGAAWLW